MLRPSAQRGVIVARAEVVEAGGAVQIATGVLPGVGNRLVLLEQVAEQVVDVAIDQVAAAVHHAHHRLLFIIAASYLHSFFLLHRTAPETREIGEYYIRSQ